MHVQEEALAKISGYRTVVWDQKHASVFILTCLKRDDLHWKGAKVVVAHTPAVPAQERVSDNAGADADTIGAEGKCESTVTAPLDEE